MPPISTSIRTRLVVQNLLTIALAVALVLALVTIAVWQHEVEEAQDRLERTARALSQSFASRLLDATEAADHASRDKEVAGIAGFISENAGKAGLAAMLADEQRSLAVVLGQRVAALPGARAILYGMDGRLLCAATRGASGQRLWIASTDGFHGAMAAEGQTPRSDAWRPVAAPPFAPSVAARSDGRPVATTLVQHGDSWWAQARMPLRGEGLSGPDFTLKEVVRGQLVLELPIDRRFLSAQAKLFVVHLDLSLGDGWMNGLGRDLAAPPAPPAAPGAPGLAAESIVFGESSIAGETCFTGLVPLRGGSPGTLLIAISQDETMREVREIVALAAIAGAAAAAVALLLGLWMSGSIARPLSRTVAVLRAMANGDTAQRLDESGPHEIAELARAVNTTVDGMQGAIDRAVESRRQAEEEARRARRLEAIGRLAGGVAHDFNNLLTPIMGGAELLRERLQGKDHERATAILAAATRARTITGQLLSFHRRQQAQVADLDLNRLVTGFEPILRQLLRENITLVLSPSATACGVRADAGQLEQALMNLVLNAQDASPRGGTITISTSLVALAAGPGPDLAAGDWVRLEVADQGGGMPPETLDRLFEPFFTTKGPGKGTGLGLYTVHGVVVAHGGAISARSTVGTGTVFTIHLPAVAIEGKGRATSGPRPAIPPSLGETVAVVEDDDLVREITIGILQGLGYRALAFATPEAALAGLAAHPEAVHLLLTDVVMPGSSGAELAMRIRQQRPTIAVLYMTGYSDGELAAHGLGEQGAHVLPKPFTPQALATRIREILDRRIPPVGKA